MYDCFCYANAIISVNSLFKDTAAAPQPVTRYPAKWLHKTINIVSLPLCHSFAGIMTNQDEHSPPFVYCALLDSSPVSIVSGRQHNQRFTVPFPTWLMGCIWLSGSQVIQTLSVGLSFPPCPMLFSLISKRESIPFLFSSISRQAQPWIFMKIERHTPDKPLCCMPAKH